MTQVIQIANIVDDTNIGFKNPQRGRVYDAEGIAPCLNTCGGGGVNRKSQLCEVATPTIQVNEERVMATINND